MGEMQNLIIAKKEEFNELVKKHPRKIPLKEMAKFLEMKEENLRIAITQKAIAGAFHTVSESGVKAFYILPVPFMNWYFNLGVNNI
jgi:hypothetical protein